MRLLICGSRNWHDYGLILQTLRQIKSKVEVVIEGECRGADLMGRDAAEYLDIEVLRFPADWNKHGKAAGPIRNSQMLREGRPTHVLAFHDDLDNSRGTKDMVGKARKAGLKVRVISHRDNERKTT